MPDSATDYRAYFEHAPLSIWVEDFSLVAGHVRRLQAEGVTDFTEYFRTHPDDVMTCISRMRVVEVNAHTLAMYGAKDLEHLIASLPIVFPPESLSSLTESLAALASGAGVHVSESVNRRVDGSEIDVSVQWAVMPGHEHDWSRVLVSIQDISVRKASERAQAKLVDELRSAMAQIKWLSDLIPICAGCKKIRDDAGFWQQVEDYLHVHAGTRFSHGMCPDCMVTWYGPEGAADD